MHQGRMHVPTSGTPALAKKLVGREDARRQFSSLNTKPAYHLEPIFEEELNTVGLSYLRYIVLSGMLDN